MKNSGNKFELYTDMKIFSAKYRYQVIISSLISLGIFTLLFYSYVMDISTPYPNIKTVKSKDIIQTKKETIYIGIISRYPPEIIYKGYQPIMDYLNTITDYNFELKLSSSYQETVEQLAQNEVAGAFLGTYLYIRAHDQYGVKCILKPLNENLESVSSSAVIVKSGSGINSIKDLKGKKLALPSTESFSGNWLTGYELQNNGLTISDLDSISYFDHHQDVIYQVLKNRFDVGVVKERIAKEYINKGIVIIKSSTKIPGPPFVVPKNDNIEITSIIKNAFLKIDERNPYYKSILTEWDSEYSHGFVDASDDDFDYVRRILSLSKDPR